MLLMQAKAAPDTDSVYMNNNLITDLNLIDTMFQLRCLHILILKYSLHNPGLHVK